MALRIEDYALIGDTQTAALVGRDGSIDWLCVPHFHAPACFASLLGEREHGRFSLAPADPECRSTRRYVEDTLVLETVFETADGRCKVTDFMPVRGEAPTIVRIVSGIEGAVRMCMDVVVRFDYGRLIPWMTTNENGLIAIAGPDKLILQTPVLCRGDNFAGSAEFTVRAGDSVPFVLSYWPSHVEPLQTRDVEAALKETIDFWRDWAAKCNYEGEWRDAVIRSLITLKAQTFDPTGGIIAAPTTSLPERLGGVRNWDYRYCWLRDATFALLSLMKAGYMREAEKWRGWLVRAVAGDPSQLQPIYDVSGVHRIDEWIAPWLPGYEGSRPVRIGNDAYSQLQLDTFGEVLDALHHARRFDLDASEASWSLQRMLLSHLETLLDTPDKGIWEVRGPPQHFTYSKVMMWVAFDRGVSAIADFGLDGPVEHWRRLRDNLHREICENAFDAKMGAFVQSYESRLLDSATLLMPMVGFLPPGDPRIVGTTRAIQQRLMRDGLLMRYDTSLTDDGLPEGEGRFIACTLWLADNLILQGRHQEGRELFERVLSLRNDVGLLAEEYDTREQRFVGNFPQALSHLALVGTAYNLSKTQGPARERAKHMRDTHMRDTHMRENSPR